MHIVLIEGRQRQVRRMLAALGCTVERLQRVRIGPLRLGDLEREGSIGVCDRNEISDISGARGRGSAQS